MYKKPPAAAMLLGSPITGALARTDDFDSGSEYEYTVLLLKLPTYRRSRS